MNLKSFASLAVALCTSLGAGMAQAGPDVQWSVSIGAPLLMFHGQSEPVYTRPGRVYVQPAPVYVQPAPVYVRPAPMYAPRHAARWDRDGDGIPNRHDRYDNRYDNRRDGWRDPQRRDRDHDGVPNRHDRFPENPWRR